MTKEEKSLILQRLKDCDDIEYLKLIQTYINKRLDFETTLSYALKAQELLL